MIIDVAVCLLIGLFFYKGFSKGFIMALLSAVAMLLGVVVALTLAQKLSLWLMQQNIVSGKWVPMLSYAILFFGVIWGIRLLGQMLEGAMKMMMLGFANKAAGGVLYALMGAVLASTLLWLGGHMHLFASETIAQSKLFYIITPLAPWVFYRLGVLLPFIKEVFDGLSAFFQTLQRT